MLAYSEMSKDELKKELEGLKKDYNEICKKNISLDMSRGKPGKEQLDLSMDMLDVLTSLQGQIHLVNFSSDRLYPLETLGFEVLSMEEMEKRLQVTNQRALVCGSLYFVGEVLKWFNSK